MTTVLSDLKHRVALLSENEHAELALALIESLEAARNPESRMRGDWRLSAAAPKLIAGK